MDYRELTREILDLPFTEETDRDKQVNVGPSDIADECDACLGLKLLRKIRPVEEQEKSISLKGWVGTAVHARLESYFRSHAQELGTTVEILVESKVPVYHLDGYGTISGHVDLIVIYYDDYGEIDRIMVIDHKTADMVDIRTAMMGGVWNKHVYQIMMYAYGVRHEYDVDRIECGVHYIPRDTNNVHDRWIPFASYKQTVAEDALLRLEYIWDVVQAGNITDLEPSRGCFNCRNWVI